MWIESTRVDDGTCPGCGGACDAPQGPGSACALGTRSLVFGSVGFFLGPVILAIIAASLVDDGGPLQLVATAGALAVGMAVAWLIGRALGYSRERPS